MGWGWRSWQLEWPEGAFKAYTEGYGWARLRMASFAEWTYTGGCISCTYRLCGVVDDVSFDTCMF